MRKRRLFRNLFAAPVIILINLLRGAVRWCEAECPLPRNGSKLQSGSFLTLIFALCTFFLSFSLL